MVLTCQIVVGQLGAKQLASSAIGVTVSLLFFLQTNPNKKTPCIPSAKLRLEGCIVDGL